MRYAILCAALVALAACGNDAHEEEHAEEAHAHAAQHGGEIVVVVEHGLFLEVKHDEEAGAMTVWAYAGEAMADAKLDEPPVLNFVGESGPTQLTAEQAGGAWTFRDDALKGEPEGARLRLRAGGKTYTPALPHAH